MCSKAKWQRRHRRPLRAPQLGTATVTLAGAGARVLIDAACGEAGPIGKPATVAVTLPPGRCQIDRAAHGRGRNAVMIYRLRPADAALATPRPSRPRPKAADELTVDATSERMARGLRFVGTDGLPVLGIPVPLLPTWTGMRECGRPRKVGTIAIGHRQGLLLDCRSVAILPTTDGALLLYAIACDDGAQAELVQLVRSAPPRAWKKQRVTFTMIGAALALIDPADDGRARRPARGVRAKLAAGRYAIDLLEEVETERVIARAVRLRRLR